MGAILSRLRAFIRHRGGLRRPILAFKETRQRDKIQSVRKLELWLSGATRDNGAYRV
jgi:hypothetical protein